MSFPASVVLNRAQTTLIDLTGVTWPLFELMDYLNAGITTLCSVKPDACAQSVPFTLTPNTPVQNIPADGFQFIKATRNLTSPFRAITMIDQNHLDNSDPYWPGVYNSSIYNYMFDKREPLLFRVYPIPNAAFNIEITYAQRPTRIANLNDTINLDEIYESPLHHFTVAHALMKNSKRGDIQKYQMYMGMFNSMLNIRTQIQLQVSPEVPSDPQDK